MIDLATTSDAILRPAAMTDSSFWAALGNVSQRSHRIECPWIAYTNGLPSWRGPLRTFGFSAGTMCESAYIQRSSSTDVPDVALRFEIAMFAGAAVRIASPPLNAPDNLGGDSQPAISDDGNSRVSVNRRGSGL